MTRTLALLAALLCAAACHRDPAPSRQPTHTVEEPKTTMPTPGPAPHAPDERLTENSPASLSGQQVVVFNIWERPYTRADGTHTTGAAGVLSVSDGKTVQESIVGAGSRVDIAGTPYDVIAVDSGKSRADQLGFAVLRRSSP